MWVLSQDKRRLMNVASVWIDTSKATRIMASSSGSENLIAEYKDAQTAATYFADLVTAINNGLKTHKMPENK